MDFKSAVENTSTISRTENGMKAYESTLDSLTDLFFTIGASRGKNITPAFTKAYTDNEDLAIRLALWARDVRGGAGERKLFRDILLYIERYNPGLFETTNLLSIVPEVGRWDDLLVFKTKEVQYLAFEVIKNALDDGNGLCAKWMPRKGEVAVALRAYLGHSPKFYRKRLVSLTKVVETQMCKKEWNDINFSHVPSLAMARYTKAFNRNAPDAWNEYKSKLVKGDASVKVNAGAVYPYDVLKTIYKGDDTLADAQWNAMPNYLNDSRVLPVVDVSASMNCPAGNGEVNMDCMDIALSLGLYCSDKNVGKFKDMFVTFSSNPEFIVAKGTLSQKVKQMKRSNWGMDTNLHAVFNKLLDIATSNHVPLDEMPETILILSDMQFNRCIRFDDSAIEMIRRKYEAAGYKVPNIVFWNLNDRGNTPVKYNEQGVALVSGFSPSIMCSVLGAEEFTPKAIMLDTIMKDRYNYK